VTSLASTKASNEGTILNSSKRQRSRDKAGQIAFDFEAQMAATKGIGTAARSLEGQIRILASDYQLQMQAYALAVTELMPQLIAQGCSITSTLHFLDPNVEIRLEADLLLPDACRSAIDAAMLDIISSRQPTEFPVRPAAHCRMCNFLSICPEGRAWVRASRRANPEPVEAVKVVEAGR
jgi:hypothetical protein